MTSKNKLSELRFVKQLMVDAGSFRALHVYACLDKTWRSSCQWWKSFLPYKSRQLFTQIPFCGPGESGRDVNHIILLNSYIFIPQNVYIRMSGHTGTGGNLLLTWFIAGVIKRSFCKYKVHRNAWQTNNTRIRTLFWYFLSSWQLMEIHPIIWKKT